MAGVVNGSKVPHNRPSLQTFFNAGGDTFTSMSCAGGARALRQLIACSTPSEIA